MKFIFLLIVFLSFPVQTFAQSNDPLDPDRTSYDMCGTSSKYYQINEHTMLMLRADDYPWGVCISFRMTRKERIWTKEAMQEWNFGFANYRWDRFKTHDVVNIPSGKLFVESCDRDSMNIIWVDIESLSSGHIGYYSPRDTAWDFSYFHGILRVSSNVDWTRELFINVMIHELSHALGIPHAPPGAPTNLLHRSVEIGCKHPRYEICKITEYDFETFIEPFPGRPMSRREYEQILWQNEINSCNNPSSRTLCR